MLSTEIGAGNWSVCDEDSPAIVRFSFASEALALHFAAFCFASRGDLGMILRARRGRTASRS